MSVGQPNLLEARTMIKQWYVYIVKARDESLYTGISIDVMRRIMQHNKKKGSKSLVGKLPVVLAYQELAADKSAALKREAEIKRLKRQEKLALIHGSVAQR